MFKKNISECSTQLKTAVICCTCLRGMVLKHLRCACECSCTCVNEAP